MKSGVLKLFWVTALATLSACGSGGAVNNTSDELDYGNAFAAEEMTFCPAVEERVSRYDCEDLTREDAEVRPGSAAFNVPDPMRRGQTVEVHLLVDRRSPRLIQALENRAAAEQAPIASNTTNISVANAIDDDASVNALEDDVATNAIEDDAATNSASSGSEGMENAAAPDDGDPAPTPGQVVDRLEGTPERFYPLVGRHMRAELIGQGFDIVALTPASQELRLGAQAHWIWQVTAREGGAHALTVLTVVEGVAQNRRFVLARTPKVRTVTVEVSLSGRIWDLLVAAPAWIKALTAVVVALGGLGTAWYGLPWLKQRRRSKRAGARGRPKRGGRGPEKGG